MSTFVLELRLRSIEGHDGVKEGGVCGREMGINTERLDEMPLVAVTRGRHDRTRAYFSFRTRPAAPCSHYLCRFHLIPEKKKEALPRESYSGSKGILPRHVKPLSAVRSRHCDKEKSYINTYIGISEYNYLHTLEIHYLHIDRAHLITSEFVLSGDMSRSLFHE